MEAGIPRLVELLIEHRPSSLLGATLAEAMKTAEQQPERLAQVLRRWRRNPPLAHAARPSLAFAVIGQAKADGAISPEAESDLLAELLKHWALQSSLDESARCAARPSAIHTTATAGSLRLTRLALN